MPVFTTPPFLLTRKHLPDNGVPSEPARWGKITGEAGKCGSFYYIINDSIISIIIFAVGTVMVSKPPFVMSSVYAPVSDVMRAVVMTERADISVK